MSSLRFLFYSHPCECEDLGRIFLSSRDSRACGSRMTGKNISSRMTGKQKSLGNSEALLLLTKIFVYRQQQQYSDKYRRDITQRKQVIFSKAAVDFAADSDIAKQNLMRAVTGK